MHWRRCKLSVLTISKILKILDGIASQFSWPQEVCYCLINHIQTELITQIYSYSAIFTFLSQSIIHQTHVFSFQDFINSKGSCLWGGPIKLRNLFTTLLALTRLLDFEVTTLPYPTRSWTTLHYTTRWGLVAEFGGYLGLVCGFSFLAPDQTIFLQVIGFPLHSHSKNAQGCKKEKLALGTLLFRNYHLDMNCFLVEIICLYLYLS